MDVAAFVLACLALGWQAWTWLSERRFEVQVRIEPELVEVGSGRYEITVVVENKGATDEALHEIWLLYAEHVDAGWVGEKLGPPSLWDRNLPEKELAPRRHIRRTYDLLATRFGGFPSEVTAVAVLQTGQHIESEPYRTEAKSLALAQAGDS